MAAVCVLFKEIVNFDVMVARYINYLQMCSLCCVLSYFFVDKGVN